MRVREFVVVLAMGLATAPTQAQEPPRSAGAAKAAAPAPSVEPPVATHTKSDASGTRADEGKLRQELAELERSIRYAEEKLKLGTKASEEWKAMTARVDKLLSSHESQSAACEEARIKLKVKVDQGVPESFLADLKRHVGRCDEARKRYRGMIASLETEVAKMEDSIKGVLSNIDDLRLQQTGDLRTKSTLQQLLGTGVSGMKGTIDAFKDYKGH